MLDDAAKIAAIDKADALKVAASEADQLADQAKFAPPPIDRIDQVVLVGMGGSAQPGLLIRTWLEADLKVPFVITRDYELPGFVNDHTLFIASSYSGNTEETIAALGKAEAKKAAIVVLTSGGKLAEIAKQNSYPLLLMPPGDQPRMTTNAGFKLLHDLFVATNLIDNRQAELLHAKDWLNPIAQGYGPSVPTSNNQAKQIAQAVFGKSILIYGSPLLSTVAYKWKIFFNENAKNLAWSNALPEFDHNEFIGWSGAPPDKPFVVINLHSKFDGERIARRFTVANRLLEGKMPKPLEITAQGESRLDQILWTVQLGEFASIYLAILNGVDPTPVDLVEELKKSL